MSVCVFCGPTLSVQESQAVLAAAYLPPASHGDVYRTTLQQPRPRAIGIIDGAFRTVPAVRHKEILWAMTQGIHVFGAASMGALRAAELADFGMVGVGEIFAQYRSGALEDDDEVAVDHAPAELGYLPLNEAMVDIRATLAAALRDAVVSPALHDRLIALAKTCFYRQRTYAGLLAAARHAGLAVEGVADWLPAGRVERKKADARALLRHIADFVARDPAPFAPDFSFERTEVWEDDVTAAKAGSLLARAAPTLQRGGDAVPATW